MNPIILNRQVELGLKDLVRSTLNTTSPAFTDTVERFLCGAGELHQGPLDLGCHALQAGCQAGRAV